MTIKILYLTMVQVCNILHKQSQSDLTKIEGVAAIFAILSMITMLVRTHSNYYKMAIYRQISNFKVSMEVSLRNTSFYCFRIF